MNDSGHRFTVLRLSQAVRRRLLTWRDGWLTGDGSRAGRSILAVLIFHGMMNFTGEWLRISPDMYPFMLTGNLLAAVLLVLWWNKKRRSD